MTDLDFDITKLFKQLNSVEAAIIECVTKENLSYVIIVGWLQNSILLKIEAEIRVIVPFYQLKDNDSALKKFEWLIKKNDLQVKTVIHVYADNDKEMMAELYNEKKQKKARLVSTKSGQQEVTYSYCILLDGLDYQSIINEHNGFLYMLKKHQPPLRIIKASPDPIILSRKQKIKNLEFD